MRFVKSIDWWIFLPSLIIFVLDITVLLSIAPSLFKTQLLYGMAALLIYLIVSNIDYRVYLSLDKLFYIASLFFLLITFFVGTVTRGSIRWIDFGAIRLQPSEIIKPLMVVFLARSYLKNGFCYRDFFVQTCLYFLLLFLILLQPDLGNMIVFFTLWLVLFFVSLFRIRVFTIVTILAALSLPFLWRFLHQYQKERIISFLNPQSDPLGIGYNAIQAMIAVGSGEFFGRGLGRGTQSYLKFLPEYHTDFIFASFSEELGFVGVLVLLFLYLILLYRMLNLARQATDKFAGLLSIGVFAIVFVQVTINIGMNIGLLPVTGITLPLMSYGGSSLVSMGILLGIGSSISRHIPRPEGVLIR